MGGAVLAFLEITRAAFVSLGRKLGPWLLQFAAVVALFGLLKRPYSAPDFVCALLLVGGAILVFAAIPAVAGTGLNAWLRTGPLRLASRVASYWTTVGYGLGAALVALPFVVAAMALVTWGPWGGIRISNPGEAIPVAVVGLMVAAWLGAASGRLSGSGTTVVALSWLSAMVVLVASAATVVVLRGALPGRLALGNRWEDAAAMAVALAVTHLLVLGASWADRRAALAER